MKLLVVGVFASTLFAAAGFALPAAAQQTCNGPAGYCAQVAANKSITSPQGGGGYVCNGYWDPWCGECREYSQKKNT